ncbi:hypothetical protein FHX77_000980 [Bifidobacterium commune]|uniref:Thymidine phosphorylase n=1 Tax=Bifidobacterium commune TaxID=1505727 RepID=A0A1C4H775_9BIFI|nr:hypothetical protein [Bifidobacterium commune]SCC80642.1 hypothetical protein GA0061077_1295 [Bifidobacterium commune]
MSTNSVHYSSGSVNSAHPGFAPASTGSLRPSRPAQLDPALTEKMAGGMDPEEISEMSHASAQALLDRVHHTQDPQIVQRVLTLVDHEGVDIIAELWSKSEPDSLPGILWRLYLLRTWMHKNRHSLAGLYRIAEPEDTAASAIAGVDTPPSADDIMNTADSILSGAFTGDFAVALERASAFVDVIAKGLAIRAKTLTAEARKAEAGEECGTIAAASRNPRTAAAGLLHTGGNLMTTSTDFRHGASLWRQGKLE